jgi:predicted deacylase
MNELQFGNVKAAPGQRATGVLTVGQFDQLGFSRGSIDLPLILLNGKQSGPMLLLLAGTHAGEYEGIESVVRVTRMIDPSELSGSIVAIPVLNIYGFAAKVPYVCPLDNLNLGSTYPGYSAGTVSQRITYAVWHQIAKTADYLIDMHGGDFTELQADYAICFQVGDPELDRKSEQMARYYGMDYIRKNPLPKTKPETGNPGLMAMEHLRIPAIVSEIGDRGHLNPKRLEKDIAGLLNVLRFIEMLPGTPTPPPDGQHTVLDRLSVIASVHGIVRTELSIYDKVSRGQVVAEVVNFYGDTIETLHSPCDGVVFQIFYQSATNPGNVVMKIGVLGQ